MSTTVKVNDLGLDLLMDKIKTNWRRRPANFTEEVSQDRKCLTKQHDCTRISKFIQRITIKVP